MLLPSAVRDSAHCIVPTVLWDFFSYITAKGAKPIRHHHQGCRSSYNKGRQGSQAVWHSGTFELNSFQSFKSYNKIKLYYSSCPRNGGDLDRIKVAWEIVICMNDIQPGLNKIEKFTKSVWIKIRILWEVHKSGFDIY